MPGMPEHCRAEGTSPAKAGNVLMYVPDFVGNVHLLLQF